MRWRLWVSVAAVALPIIAGTLVQVADKASGPVWLVVSLIAVAGIGSTIQAVFALKASGGQPYVSDIQVTRLETFEWLLDMRVTNKGGSTVLVDRVLFELVEAHLEDPLMSALEPSATYELDISRLQAPGSQAQCLVAQKIKPGDVDRFQIVLTAHAYGSFMYRLRSILVCNFGSFDGPVIEISTRDEVSVEMSRRQHSRTDRQDPP
jgi:hypothetical protein